MKGEEFLKQMDRIDDGLIQSAANANGKGKRIVLVGFVAALLAALTVAAVAVGIAMTGKTNAPLPPETEIETNAETEEQTDEKETAQTAAETEETVIPKEELSSDYVIFKNAADDNSGLQCTTNGYYIKGHFITDKENTENVITVCYPDSSFEKLTGLLNDTEYDLLGKKHSDISEYEIIIYNQNYKNKQWVTLIVPDNNIELITPEIPYYYFERSDEHDIDIKTINISFRFKENCHNGYIHVYIFAGEKSLKAFEDDYKDADIQERLKSSDNPNGTLDNYNTFIRIGFTCVKGYDFSDYDLGIENLYKQAAIYFGDVDENGKPLYMTDLDMPDYKDNPWCVSKREYQEYVNKIREEAHEKAQAREKETE